MYIQNTEFYLPCKTQSRDTEFTQLGYRSHTINFINFLAKSKSFKCGDIYKLCISYAHTYSHYNDELNTLYYSPSFFHLLLNNWYS